MDISLLHDFLQANQAPDEWWLAVDGKILDNPVACAEVERMGQQLPQASLHVLHVSQIGTDASEWVEVRAKSRPREERKTADPCAGTADRLAQVEIKVELLQHTLDAIINMLRELNSFEELRQMLDERSEFITQSEEALIAQTMEFEERSAELEQKREDMGLE